MKVHFCIETQYFEITLCLIDHLHISDLILSVFIGVFSF